MVIPKIEAPLGRDNHAVTSSFLAPTYELHLINSPAHEPPVTRRLRFFLLSPLCCRPSSAAAAAGFLVFTNSGRCINLT